MTRRVTGAAAVAAAAMFAAAVSAQHGAETFTATAWVKRGEASATAPVTLTIERYASAAERDAVLTAVKQKGTAGAQQVLAAMPDAGVIEMGGRKTPVKFAVARPTGSGRLLTVLTAQPILFLGAGLPDAPPRQGYDLGVALLDVTESGAGMGELAPAAKVGVDANGALFIDDYGADVIWLRGLARAK